MAWEERDERRLLFCPPTSSRPYLSKEQEMKKDDELLLSMKREGQSNRSIFAFIYSIFHAWRELIIQQKQIRQYNKKEELALCFRGWYLLKRSLQAWQDYYYLQQSIELYKKKNNKNYLRSYFYQWYHLYEIKRREATHLQDYYLLRLIWKRWRRKYQKQTGYYPSSNKFYGRYLLDYTFTIWRCFQLTSQYQSTLEKITKRMKRNSISQGSGSSSGSSNGRDEGMMRLKAKVFTRWKKIFQHLQGIIRIRKILNYHQIKNAFLSWPGRIQSILASQSDKRNQYHRKLMQKKIAWNNPLLNYQDFFQTNAYDDYCYYHHTSQNDLSTAGGVERQQNRDSLSSTHHLPRRPTGQRDEKMATGRSHPSANNILSPTLSSSSLLLTKSNKSSSNDHLHDDNTTKTTTTTAIAATTTGIAMKKTKKKHTLLSKDKVISNENIYTWPLITAHPLFHHLLRRAMKLQLIDNFSDSINIRMIYYVLRNVLLVWKAFKISSFTTKKSLLILRNQRRRSILEYILNHWMSFVPGVSYRVITWIRRNHHLYERYRYLFGQEQRQRQERKGDYDSLESNKSILMMNHHHQDRVKHHHRVKYRRPIEVKEEMEERDTASHNSRMIRQSKYFNAMTLASSKQEYQPRL